ncbi:MAG: hypothetical protein II180_03360 [Proteobacteria bacterium]|nr:hypothetical protein [Pseudomonadota bacterium]
MASETKKRLALICCAAAAFAFSGCGDGDSSTSTGDACSKCTSDQICEDGVCKDKPVDDPCAKCGSDQTCEDGVCKDKPVDPDPCDACTDGQKCVDKVCKDLCGSQVCSDSQKCVDSVCKNLCGSDVCADDKICDKASQTCIDKPDDYDPCDECTDNQECINDVCVDKDPCANKVCEDGQRCDAGACVDIDPCESVTCGDAQTCIKAKCYDDACLENGVEKDCGEGQVFSKGACVKSGCADMTCDEGWQCVTSACDESGKCTGVCVETVCIDYFCEDGRTCKGGKCVDNECLDMTCNDDMICSKGKCTYEVCLEKDPCVTGKSCNAEGVCVFDVAPAISIDDSEDKSTDEAGDTATLVLHLNNAPTADVTLNCEVVTESTNKEVDVACGEIVLTADNWQAAHDIIVTGVDDYVKDGDQVYKVKITTVSEDADFNGLEVESFELTNVDKTAPGFVFSETSLTTFEDQEQPAAKFTIFLSSIPSSDVSLTLNSSNQEEGKVSPTTVTFTKENWNVPAEITVQGQDDDVQDGSVNYTIFFSPSESNDEDYSGIQPKPIKVTNVDNDVAGVAITTPDELVVLEGQTVNVPVRLNTEPKKDVKIKVELSNKEAHTDVEEITLNSENWKEGVIVHISGTQDEVIDGDKPFDMTFTFTSDDESYQAIEPMKISGTVKDADTAEIFVSMGDAPIVKEGSSDFVTMSLTLSSKPTAAVDVAISVTDETEIKASKQSIKFNTNSWNSPLDVLVRPVDDEIVDGNVKSKVVLKMTSSDKNFNGKTQEIEYTTIDDDKAGFVIESNAASFPENSGSQVTMNVRLLSQPTANVTVNVTSSDASELSIAGGSQLTFTKDNWNKNQLVTVKVVDDDQADSTQTAYAIFKATSTDPNFNGIQDKSATYTIIDNEAPSLVLTIDGTTVGLGDPQTTAKVALGVAPTSDVKVTLASDSNVTSFNPANALTFTKDNWSQPQSVTINVDFEKIATAAATATISAKATASNSYNNITSNNVVINMIKVPEVQNFAYTGNIQQALLPKGRYQLEVWGAEGGTYQVGYPGGKGGYAMGTLNVQSTTTVYIVVGGTTNSSTGGYNGGGASVSGRGGGGATHIATATGLLKDLSSKQSNVLIVGGAGGGGAGISGYAGAGGGLIGEDGYNSHTPGYAKGGTQSAGGAGEAGHSATGGSGSFGQGGNASGEAAGGGGAGWYGGGGSGNCGGVADDGGGAGGSSYMSNTLSSTKTIAGSASMPAPQGGNETGHAGNGYARITLLK